MSQAEKNSDLLESRNKAIRPLGRCVSAGALRDGKYHAAVINCLFTDFILIMRTRKRTLCGVVSDVLKGVPGNHAHAAWLSPRG